MLIATLHRGKWVNQMMKRKVEQIADVFCRRGDIGFAGCAVQLFFFCLFCSCAAPKIDLRVKRPAEMDTSDYRKVAVADFRGPGRSRSQATSILTSQIFKTGYFEMLERQQIEKILDEQDFAVSGAVDDASAAKMGEILGVQALIFGDVTGYSAEDKQGLEKVRKQVWTGPYETDQDGNIIYEEGLFGVKHKKKQYREQFVDEPFVVRSATVSISFRVVDVETGHLVAVKSESSSYN